MIEQLAPGLVLAFNMALAPRFTGDVTEVI
jgi:hypothetical protein